MRRLLLAAAVLAAGLSAACVPQFGFGKPTVAEPIAAAAALPEAVATVKAPVVGRPAPAAPAFVAEALAEPIAPAAVPTLPVPAAASPAPKIEVTVAAPPAAPVTYHWGDDLLRWFSILMPVLTPLGLYLVTLVPGPIGAFLRMWMNERRMQELVGRAYTAVQGAVEGQAVTVDVGNSMLAWIAQKGVEELTPQAIKWLGGEDGIRSKASALIPFEPGASAASVEAE
jgi:hypothetical protein